MTRPTEEAAGRERSEQASLMWGGRLHAMRIEGEKWARKTSSTSTAEITIHSIRLGGLSLRCPRGMQVKMSKKQSGVGRGVEFRTQKGALGL